MTLDFVSEVDRRFFANNLLTNEDWDMSELNVPHEEFPDISDLLELDGTVTHDSFLDLSDEHISVNPISSESPQHSDFKNEKPDPDDCWREHSDSSDSGIYGTHIKEEPPSPISSNVSETGSEGYGSASDNTIIQLPTEIKCEGTSPVTTLSFGPSSPQTAFSFHIADDEALSPATDSLYHGTVHGSVVNINSILNSKVKIQPKPYEKISTPTAKKPLSQNAPLVVTPAEFAKLTAAGKICFQHPESASVSAMSSVIAIPNGLGASPLTGLTGTHTDNDGDPKIVRRQQRMIKNRESASLSRKRKKEYLSILEVKLRNFTSENQKLKQENETLKRKLDSLQIENEKLKTVSISSAKKMCLFAVFVLFTLNLGPISDIITNNSNSIPVMSNNLVHKGRQLMSVEEDRSLSFVATPKQLWSHPADTVFRRLQELSAEMESSYSAGKINQTDFEALMCPNYLNATESMRLAEQLAGWMIRHEEQKTKTAARRKQKRRKEIHPVNTLKKALHGGMKKLDTEYLRAAEARYQLQLFQGMGDKKGFFEAIHRRNDTFYVLSFNSDYLLVPAIAHNKTMRPRMSLVMPAVALNESMQPPPGSIGMMQIDCEVLDTQLIHVHKSVVPEQAHSRANHTFH
ncbi:cyclic AMP-dependent transcription factor ATF-6 beta-like [Gigantopelta aegis]|uniref:cyclic AMP-dependent transcription factor ATF-6 beta-like n=1 Tax=Gigantopelta aegis TaxID=1735272 RepID=UPI001B888578|nr:cyclic AMP-dependent transcription factor ATF-6 beta-like [Gigantopelta aegis]